MAGRFRFRSEPSYSSSADQVFSLSRNNRAAVTRLTLVFRAGCHSYAGLSGGLSRRMVIAMNLAASFALTLTLVGSGLQTTAAQSPPKSEQNALVWSDRDLSLHQGGFDASPQLILRHPFSKTWF